MKMLRLIKPIGSPCSSTGKLIRSRYLLNTSSTSALVRSDEMVGTGDARLDASMATPGSGSVERKPEFAFTKKPVQKWK